MKKIVLLMGFVILAIIIAGCSSMSKSVRSSQEVVKQHHEKVGTLDIERIIPDYADDAILVMSTGDTLIGKEAIKAGFAGFFKGFPNLKFTEYEIFVEDDIVMLTWKGECDTGTISYAVDTFVIRDDRIQRQTCWLTFVPK